MQATFRPVAEHALLVSFAAEISEAAHAQVLTLEQAIATAAPAGVVETVPALVNLLVCFDVLTTDHAAVELAVRALLREPHSEGVSGRTHRVAVCYEPPFAPDLDAVASATGLGAEAVINAHLAGDYHVLMYGFAPGYAYLGGLPDSIRVPRKPAPVRDVPAGSVIIAGSQCLVTTLVMPTGWSIIGRSPTPILTGQADRPFLFDVGDRVVFDRIGLDACERLMSGHTHV
ncbi:5-oxoprolinase subunit B family protein [Yoonia sp.]|uniref:5-oxoprolinase subunit B family protein n=1 Tax=Yoonia sp. TaxID=2212373 RepID=UPI003FCE6109